MKNKKMKIIFISGPLTSGWDGKSHSHLLRNIRIAERYQIALANFGIGAFCPHAHCSFHHEKGSRATKKYYYDLDLEFLKRASDAVLAIPGWEKSKGAVQEIACAKKIGLPIFYPKSPNDLLKIINWTKKSG